MADKHLADEKFPEQQEAAVVGAEVMDEEMIKLDKRVTRKMDIRIMPWLIVR